MHAGDRFSAADFAEIRRRAIFECCKWDPQAGDVSVLAPYPLVLEDDEWREISVAAEQLHSELLAAENELVARPPLVSQLGLPRAIARLFDGRRPAARSGPRVMRFDFHWTADGWRISEANSDVPGGFIEGGGFTALVAGASPGLQATGNPAERYVDALVASAGQRGAVALVHATAYVDDRQVMIYLARNLAARGLRSILVSPAQIFWRDGRAHAYDHGEMIRVDLIVRFFPGEWLPNLPRRCPWRSFFVDGDTPQSNPATALLSQSKRLPLVWDELSTPMPRWRALLPETRDPRSAPWRTDEGWIVKTALGRVGDGIGMHGVTSASDWRLLTRAARWWPREFIAQRRFAALPLETPDGPRFASLGVFTIDGRASGIYARVARRPLVDHAAQDIAVLIWAPARLSTTPRTGIRDELRTSV